MSKPRRPERVVGCVLIFLLHRISNYLPAVKAKALQCLFSSLRKVGLLKEIELFNQLVGIELNQCIRVLMVVLIECEIFSLGWRLLLS